MSLHQYLYANASPVSFKDPSGRFSMVNLMTAGTLLSAAAAQYYVMMQGFVARLSIGMASISQPLGAVVIRSSNAIYRVGQILEASQKAMRIVRTADFSTPVNRAALYLGQEEEAIRQGLVTIRSTQGGQLLQEFQWMWEAGGLARLQYIRIWSAASTKYAEAAMGIVRCFVRLGGDRPSIFYNTELPVLMSRESAGEVILHFFH
jgi:hypothetical protein